MGKRELVALLNLSSWCLVMVERLVLAVPRGCLRLVNVVFPDHTLLLFLYARQITGLAIALSLSEIFGQQKGTIISLTVAFLLRLSIYTNLN